jgi:hypothetical protein
MLSPERHNPDNISPILGDSEAELLKSNDTLRGCNSHILAEGRLLRLGEEAARLLKKGSMKVIPLRRPRGRRSNG